MAEELVIRSADTAAGRAGLLQKIAAGLCINAVFLTPPHTPSTDLTPLALCILLTLGFSFAALYLDIFSKQLKLSSIPCHLCARSTFSVFIEKTRAVTLGILLGLVIISFVLLRSGIELSYFPPSLISAALASIALSFILSGPSYRMAIVEKEQALELVYGTAPLWWTLSLALPGLFA